MELVYPILCQVITNGELASLKQQLLSFTTNPVFRYSVTAITSRFHRGDRGSTPRIGVISQISNIFFSIFFCVYPNMSHAVHVLNYIPLLFFVC